MDCTRHILNKYKRSDNDRLNDSLFQDESIDEIHLYGINVPCKAGKKRKILIELHISKGFAMIKFYPKKLRNSPAKFQLRGEQLGFQFGIESVKKILFECAIIMRDYLEENPDCFVGYIGQTDNRDNRDQKKRITAQRADIYNLFTNSIFLYPKYKLSSRKIFQEVNLRLIRKIRSKQNGRINKAQKMSYDLFLSFFERNNDKHFELMTETTRNQYI